MAVGAPETVFVAGTLIVSEQACNYFVPVRPPPAYAPPPANSPEPEPAEKQEKQEKGEKQEKNEKGEKHEKQRTGLLGPVICGIVLIILGIMGYLSITQPSVQPMLEAYFLVIVGVVILIAAIYGAIIAVRRHPPA